MIDTVKIEMLVQPCAPDQYDIADYIKSLGYPVKSWHWSTHFGDANTYFRASDGALVPTGTIMFTRSRKCYAEEALGNVINGHNAHLLSFDEAESALREYLRVLGDNLPFVDVTSARATRVDAYWQWRVVGNVDWAVLPFMLGDFGPCSHFEVRGAGTSVFIQRTKNYKVRLYNKSLKMGDSDAPDGIIRLEVELHGNARERYQNPLAPTRRKARKPSVSPLRKSGVVISTTGEIPVDGSPIFDRAKIVEALQHEWRGVYLAPLTNASDLMSATSTWASTALVLHDHPVLHPTYLDNKGGNRSHAASSLREVDLVGPPDSLMCVPDLDEMEEAFPARSSGYYVREVHWQSYPPYDCDNAVIQSNVGGVWT